MKKKFVIISHGRAGSTVVCNALNLNPTISCAYELFGLNDQHKPDPLIEIYSRGSGKRFLEKFYATSKKNIVGFKMFTFHARNSEEELEAWDYLIKSKDILCILLSRKDLLASYFSEERAKSTGVWHPNPSGDNKNLDRKIWIDPLQAERYLYRVYAEMTWIRNRFSDHKMIELYYEDLQEDFEGGIKQLSKFLGVDYVSTGIRFDSLLGDDFRNVVENYDDVMRQINLTIFRDGDLL